MQSHEYLAVPAPAKGTKAKGLKSPAERYAHALSAAINELAADGWEYWRAETLPSEERKGLTGSVTMYHSLLIFRRPSAEALASTLHGAGPSVAAPVQMASVESPSMQATPVETPASPDASRSERDLMEEAENLFVSTDAHADTEIDNTKPPEQPVAPMRLSTRAPEGPAPRVTVTPREDRTRED